MDHKATGVAADQARSAQLNERDRSQASRGRLRTSWEMSERVGLAFDDRRGRRTARADFQRDVGGANGLGS